MDNFEDRVLDQKVLEITNLKKYFGETKAVDGISLCLEPGEIYGLLGPNGAGKTTTIKCILGLLDLQEGDICVLGKSPIEDPQDVKANIGYVSEEPSIYASMTPRELFNFIASIRRLDRGVVTRRVKKLLKSLDAMQYADKIVEALSRGNKQKIQIIAALMHEPPLLILDEPLTGLDAKSAKIVKDILQLHAQRGGAVLLSSHIMEIAQNLCTRIGIINKGKMIAEGTLDELRQLVHETTGGESLEEIFLRLTEQDQSVKEIVAQLRISQRGD